MATGGSKLVSPPDVRGLLAPLLPSLPGAAVANKPAAALLPLLSPILRQRVQLLSEDGTEPWLRLLSYDTTNAAKLAEVVRGDRFEPHPVSGELEIDWDYDVETRYRRLDSETLQALVVFNEFGLFFRLVYCTGDSEGGGDGWRIGEVSVADPAAPFASFGGKPSIAEAQQEFDESRAHLAVPSATKTNGATHRSSVVSHDASGNNDDDDDDYWAQYDATPGRTPANKRSPVSMSMLAQPPTNSASQADEDAYFAQYNDVQPAMDNHDPDEEANAAALADAMPPALNLPQQPGAFHLRSAATTEDSELNETNGVWTLAGGLVDTLSRDGDEDGILHPRPASSLAGSSTGSSIVVAKLEESAERREQGEFGVKQHISRSIKSLFLLSRASGIDRDEFESMVKTELDLLGMMEED